MSVGALVIFTFAIAWVSGAVTVLIIHSGNVGKYRYGERDGNTFEPSGWVHDGQLFTYHCDIDADGNLIDPDLRTITITINGEPYTPQGDTHE